MVAHEWKLLLQGIIICVYKCIICLGWNFYVPEEPIPYLAFISFAVIESGYNPYMYVIFNKTIRRLVAEFILCKSKKTTTIVDVATTIRTRKSQANIKENLKLISLKKI
uniref:Uncharacterized protein n=1 Tax=Acrobeloides nanus TaxID=290746 RepID=A0A914CPX6_9BILA